MLWDTALNYADRGLRIVTSNGIAPRDQLQWWERKDRISRGAIAGLVRQRWPAQEALGKALADTNTDWTVVKGAEVKGIHTAMEVADQGLELGKGAGGSKVGDRGGVVRFPTTQTRNVDLSVFPPTTTRVVGMTKVVHKARVTSLRSDSGVLETRPLSRLRVRNSVVPSTPLRAAQMNGIARRRRGVAPLQYRVCFATDHGGHQHRSWREATENFTRRSSVHYRGSWSAAPMCQASGVA